MRCADAPRFVETAARPGLVAELPTAVATAESRFARAARTHLIALAVVAVLTLVLVSKVWRDPPCAVDEPGWLRSGGVTYQLVVDRAPAETWETAYGDNEFDNRNPPVGKLMIGMMMAANGLHVPDYRWAWP